MSYDFEPLTVNLTPRSRAALDRVSARTWDTETDAVNRAIQVYDYLDEIWKSGGEVRISREPGHSEYLWIW